MESFWFNSWTTIGRTIVVGVLAYIALVALLRVFGKRTLAKLNAFDLVVTVAIGSILATILLNKDVALAEGVTAFVTLIGLQFLVTWSSIRLRWLRSVVTGDPALVFYRGQFITDALRRERITESEVRAAVREASHARLENVFAVVLETDGSLSTIGGGGDQSATSLADVDVPGERRELQTDLNSASGGSP